MLQRRSNATQEALNKVGDLPAVPLSQTTPAANALAGAHTKLLLVDFRSGEAVSQHPEIQSYLQQGWRVKSAVPRLVEAGGTRLFVVLTQDATASASFNAA